jgi:hypothetical protein
MVRLMIGMVNEIVDKVLKELRQIDGKLTKVVALLEVLVEESTKERV